MMQTRYLTFHEGRVLVLRYLKDLHVREYGVFEEHLSGGLPNVVTDCEVVASHDIRTLITVVIENSKDLYNRNRTSKQAEVTFFFGDLVLGPEFTAEERRSKVFANASHVSFAVSFSDVDELLAEMRLAFAVAHHSRTTLKLL